MLELKKITKVYTTAGEEVHALKGINLQFRESEFVAILGQSGCGKTTMLNILGGLDQYTSGDLIINGKSTKNFKDRDWDSYRNHSVGFVFQSYNLIPHQTVLQNVELALSLSGVSKAKRKAKATEALKAVGLENQLNKKPSEMSGGQMQRVAIARAIVNDPDIILADEPTGALDTQTSIQVMEILKEISKDRLVVMVTHNPELAEKYATRTVKMLDGQITEDSSPLSTSEIAIVKKAEVQKRGENEKKPTLSLATSFSLSLKNLFTKKGRTILTSFAGSIGIIGIALIYAVSNGMSSYIDSIQQDALTSYPLTIMSDTADMTSLLAAFGSNVENVKEQPDGTVVEAQMMSSVFAQMGSNNLKEFKLYLEDNYDEVDDCITTIKYGYNITPLIYTTDVAGNQLQVNPSTMFSSIAMASYMNTGVFSEMLQNDELMQESYDLVQGKWPEAYNELLFVLPDEHGITDFMAYSLGMLDKNDLEDMMQKVMDSEQVVLDEPHTWTYDDLMNLKFRLVHSSDLYKYNSEYDVWEDMSTDKDYVNNLALNGEELKIVGIVIPKSSTSALSAGVAYTPQLKNHIIEYASSSEIVKQQLADEKTDVFSKKSFDELDEKSSGSLNFNDMISIDTDLLSQAFGMNITEEYLNQVMSPYMSGISSSISVDTSQAETQVKNIFSLLCDDMLASYIGEHTDEESNCTLSSADIATYAKNYLSSSRAYNIYSPLITTYSVPKDSVTQTYEALLTPLMNMFLTGTDLTIPKENAEIKAQTIKAAYVSDATIQATLSGIGSKFAEVKMQVAVMSQVGEMMQKVIGSLSSAFNVDSNKIAQAFKFNMSEDDLTRLMSAYSSNTTNSYDSNLRKLGYSDLNKPSSISIYFNNFENKDKFMDFLDDYNAQMEDSGKDDNVISYTDTTAILMSSVKTIVNSVSYVLIAFVSISLIVSSIMIGVITLISVQERTKEIGILRAIGASKRNVSNMFNAETMIIGFTSGLLGIITTYLLCIPINAILHKLTGISTLSAKLPLGVGVSLIIISTLLTLISGIIPSRSAAKKDPVVALRTE